MDNSPIVEIKWIWFILNVIMAVIAVGHPCYGFQAQKFSGLERTCRLYRNFSFQIQESHRPIFGGIDKWLNSGKFAL